MQGASISCRHMTSSSAESQCKKQESFKKNSLAFCIDSTPQLLQAHSVNLTALRCWQSLFALPPMSILVRLGPAATPRQHEAEQAGWDASCRAAQRKPLWLLTAGPCHTAGMLQQHCRYGSEGPPVGAAECCR